MEEVDSEKVVFDEETKQAHCLTPLASVVFEHCDGKTSLSKLTRIASGRLDDPVSEDLVQQALTQLEERALLATPLPITLSRRDMVKKSAAFGAAAAAATLVTTIEPPMAQAANCNINTVCSRNLSCSGSCTMGRTCTCITSGAQANTCQCH
jgi:hypothetical protein